MSTRDQDYRIYQEEREKTYQKEKKLIKGKATKVYSINREKLKEAIKVLDEVSKRYKDMLKETEK